MNKRITISIVVYKGYEDASRVVKSIETKTDSSIEKKIYVIDNSCFEDNNAQKKAFIQELMVYCDVEYIDTEKNLGFGKGHNYILDRIMSDYHAIVNPDIELENDALSEIIRYMDQNENIGMVIPKIVDQNGNIQHVYRRELSVLDIIIRMSMANRFIKRQAYHTMQDMNYTQPFEVPFGQGSFLVIRTNLFKKIAGFDSKYFMYVEDADLCKRVNTVSKLMYYPQAIVTHKWEKASHRNLKLLKYHIESILIYFRKWGIKWK